jgi:hypothetical protein
VAGLSKTSATQNSCLVAIAAASADFILAFKTLFDPYRPERHYARPRTEVARQAQRGLRRLLLGPWSEEE